jgi:hypothetical protein
MEAHKELESHALKSKTLQRDLDAANMRIHGLKTEGGELRTENQSLTSVSNEIRCRGLVLIAHHAISQEISGLRKRVGPAEQAARGKWL